MYLITINYKTFTGLMVALFGPELQSRVVWKFISFLAKGNDNTNVVRMTE